MEAEGVDAVADEARLLTTPPDQPKLRDPIFQENHNCS